MSDYQEHILFTSDFEQAVAEIESIGGAVTHRLGERIFVARLAGEMDPQALSAASPDSPPDLNEVEQRLISAWRSVGAKQNPDKAQRDEKRKWDAPGYEPPKYDLPESDG